MPPTLTPEDEQQKPGGPDDGKNTPSDAGSDQPLTKAADDSGASRLRSFTARNKRKLLFGGTGAGIVGIIIAGFIALLPLKIESMMKNIMGDRFGPIERSMERRAMKITSKYLIRGIDSEGSFVATGNPLTDLYRTWRTQGFTQDLERNHGIKIESSNQRGKKIRITFPDGKKSDFADAPELERFLERDLGNRDARRFVRLAVRSETQWYQIYKRRHLRRWMSSAYNIRRWTVFSKKNGDAASKELDKESRRRVLNPLREEVPKWVGCVISGENCPGGRARGSVDKPVPQNEDARKLVAEERARGGGRGEVEGAFDEASEQFVDGAEAPADAPADIQGEGKSTTFSKLFSSTLTKKIIQGVSIIGLVDMLAQIDHAITENHIGDIITAKNSLQYAGVFAQWATLADNFKAGEVSSDEVGAAMQKLDGIEKSAAFNAVYQGSNGGERIAEGKEINSQRAENFSESYLKNPVLGSVIHPILSAYRSTIGKIVGAIAGLLGNIVQPLVELLPGYDQAEKVLAKAMQWAFDFAFGPVVDGTETGAALMNAIDAGADVTANDFAGSAGGRKLSRAEVTQIGSQIALEQAEDNRQLPLAERLASATNPNSFINRLAVTLPATPGGFGQAAQTMVASILSRPFAMLADTTLMLFQPARAAANLDLYGVQQYGFTDAELEAEIDEAALPQSGNVEDCPNYEEDKKANRANLCALDLITIQSLTSMYTDEDDGGIGATGGEAAEGISGERATWVEELLSSLYYHGGEYATHDIEAGPTNARDELVWLLLQVVRARHNLTMSAIKTGHSQYTSSGNISDHWYGAAADISGPVGPDYTDRNSRALYRFLFNNASTLKIDQLIFYPTGGDRCLSDGAPVDCLGFYGAATMDAHKDHIHVSVQ